MLIKRKLTKASADAASTAAMKIFLHHISTEETHKVYSTACADSRCQDSETGGSELGDEFGRWCGGVVLALSYRALLGGFGSLRLSSYKCAGSSPQPHTHSAREQNSRQHQRTAATGRIHAPTAAQRSVVSHIGSLARRCCRTSSCLEVRAGGMMMMMRSTVADPPQCYQRCLARFALFEALLTSLYVNI